ncbi:MAG: ParB/RepB/Spo0J family partition protein [Thermomicrobiales bacterium]|nr:ParB/RepB/Spo0J family partition protein [Thermomicrobiales bacterium]
MLSDRPAAPSPAVPAEPERAAPGARRGGLGRGLSALIPTFNDAPAAPLEIPIDAIEANPYQPRIEMDEEALRTLAASIRVHGVIQPLVVTSGPEPGRYVLIAGERRWRASRLAGLRVVPAVVKEAAPRAMLELALVENVVRADLGPLEEAAAYRQLIDDFGLTQAAVAERVGRSRVSVTNTLRLLALPDRVQTALTAGEVTEGHARALLGLPTAADQIAAMELVQARDLTVRQTEELVRRWVAGEPPAGVRAPAAPEAGAREAVFQQAFLDGLQRALRTKVTFRPAKEGGGTLTIHYGSDEELNAFYERLGGEELW